MELLGVGYKMSTIIQGLDMITSALREFLVTLGDFVNTLLPMPLSGVIMALISIILVLAAWRIVT